MEPREIARVLADLNARIRELERAAAANKPARRSQSPGASESKPQYPLMVKMGVAQNQVGWDWPRAHGMLS